MKYVKVLLLSFVLFTVNAFALSSPSQISTMMDTGNLRGAESALKDVLHSGKDTAKVHYMLAQVFQKEGRLPDARAELARANQMDPEHSYTDNTHYRPIADAINGRVTNTSVTAGAPIAVMTAVPSKSIDFSFLIYFLLSALLVAAAIAAFMFYLNKREEQEKFIAFNLQLHSRAALLVQDIQKAILSEKTAVSPSAARLTAINTVNFRALNVYDRVKCLVTSDISDIVRLIGEVADIRQALNEVLDAGYSVTSTTVKIKKTYAKSASTTVVEAEAAPTSQAIPSAAPTSQAIPSAAPVITQAPPQTVVVNSGLSMTDLLVADMIINEPHRHRDDEYFTRPEAPAPQPDSGNNDTWDTPSSDSGNNDSWSSSSSDSGNNDSWSSSSSDDSSSSSSDSGSSDSF